MDNPYVAFNQLNLGYSPRLYQIRGNEQRDNRIDAIPISSGNNVASIIFDSTISNRDIYGKWIYIPYNFRQTDRIEQLQEELNKLFGKSMENEDLQAIWETGTGIERERIRNSYKAVKGSFNTNSMVLYSGMEEQYLGQSIANTICYRCCCDWNQKKLDACIWGIMMLLENTSGMN